MATINLKIAETRIRIESDTPNSWPEKKEHRLIARQRIKNFLYAGQEAPHIHIDVVLTPKLPRTGGATSLFITRHFWDGKENWRLLKTKRGYVYKSPVEDKEQLMTINPTFDRVSAYLKPKRGRGATWEIDDLICDFLQVLLINYFGQRNLGVFAHAAGIRDLDGRGFLFVGKSGCGKSTTSRLWYEHTRASILNDDRVIVHKNRGGFNIYGSPWHGDFSDYLALRIKPAPLKNIFFLRHAARNQLERLGPAEACVLLYTAIFPTFWDKSGLKEIISFCDDLVTRVPCYQLGFVNDKDVIQFVRNVS